VPAGDSCGGWGCTPGPGPVAPARDGFRLAAAAKALTGKELVTARRWGRRLILYRWPGHRRRAGFGAGWSRVRISRAAGFKFSHAGGVRYAVTHGGLLSAWVT
jgi:hypothetical protein